MLFILYKSKCSEMILKSIKEFLNQPHKDYFIKNEQVKHLDKLISNAKYLTKIVDKHGNPNIPYSHIFEVVINEKSRGS